MRRFQQAIEIADVVMVGDSLTAHADWNELLSGASVANRGIGGDTTADVRRRLGSILSVQAHAAFVMLGINDILRGTPLAETLANYRAILTALPNPVILSTLQTRARAPTETIAVLNSGLKAVAVSEGYAFVDLNSAMCDADGLREEYTYDGLHLNAKGYHAWANVLRHSPVAPRLSMIDLQKV